MKIVSLEVDVKYVEMMTTSLLFKSLSLYMLKEHGKFQVDVSCAVFGKDSKIREKSTYQYLDYKSYLRKQKRRQ